MRWRRALSGLRTCRRLSGVTGVSSVVPRRSGLVELPWTGISGNAESDDIVTNGGAAPNRTDF